MRSEHVSLSGALVSCALALTGCVDFDASIYKGLDPSKSGKDGGGSGGTAGEGGASNDGGDSNSGGTNGKDGGTNGKDSGPMDAGDEMPRLVDRCDDPTAYRLTTGLLNAQNEISFMASTVGFTDDINTTLCFTGPLPGSEASMTVEMNAGERWHFHITPKNLASMGQGKQNPVLYMRDDCSDNRGCKAGTALDLCGDAQEEHFTFESATRATWHFILDDRNNVQGDYLVRAVKNICGNGIKEHNEACDTPNQGNCSGDCRLIVSTQGASPDEPNDDFSASVILGRVADLKSQTIKGSIGGVCDVDYYAFAVPDKGKIEAKILTSAGAPCTALDASVSPTKLELLNSDKGMLADGMNVGAELCPSILMSAANNLDGGFYYLRISGDETKAPFSYQLSVTVGND